MDKKVLRIGVTIRIKRSDGETRCLNVCGRHVSVSLVLGRVHDAVVSGIDTRKGFVSVEWAEGEETKGKEVRSDQLLLTSPHDLTGAYW